MFQVLNSHMWSVASGYWIRQHKPRLSLQWKYPNFQNEWLLLNKGIMGGFLKITLAYLYFYCFPTNTDCTCLLFFKTCDFKYLWHIGRISMNEPSHSCSNASYCFNGTCGISICLHFNIICQSIPSSYLLHHHQLFSQFLVAHPPSPSADHRVDGTESSEEIFPLFSPPLHIYLLTHTQSLVLL